MPRNIPAWMHRPAILAITRYLSIGCVSLTAALTLFIMQALEGRWTWVSTMRGHLSRHVSQLPAEMLPIPIAFLLWVHLMERKEPFALRFSPLACALGIVGFAAGLTLADHQNLRITAVAFGVIAGLFVLVPFGDCVQRIKNQPRPAVVAAIAATAAINYYWLMHVLWVQMCALTTWAVHAILQLFGVNMIADIVHPHGANSLLIKSPYFAIRVDPSCNGLEGIFLFNFMLSVMFLIDWDLFKNRHILLLYLFGLEYMFFFNVLRITAFFTVGYWAYRPDAWEWVQSLRGAPVYLFHSYVGWVFYLLAFGVFAAWLYQSSASRWQVTGGR